MSEVEKPGVRLGLVIIIVNSRSHTRIVDVTGADPRRKIIRYGVLA